MEKLQNQEFYNYFKNMAPMRYYEGDLNTVKAQNMINNKDDEYFGMLKKDGEWCRAIIMEDSILLQSRSISKVTGEYGDKTLHVPHIVEGLKNWPAGTVLLGELAFDDWTSTSKDVGSILRCKSPKAIERQKDKKLHYFLFDVLAYDFEILINKTFIERFVVYPEFSKSIYVKPTMNHDGENSEFLTFADYVWERGGEGVMIVRKDMVYAPGKRTAWLTLKVKKKLDKLKAKVVGFIEPNKIYEGNEAKDWKYFIDKDSKPADITKMIDFGELTAVTKPFYFGWKNGVVVEYEGRTVKVTSGLNDSIREWLATDSAKQLLEDGELFAEITGMELTDDSIRHPIFLNLIK